MLKKLFSIFAALTLSAGLWAQGSVFTYTATEKLEDQFGKLGRPVSHDFNNGAGTVTYENPVTKIVDQTFKDCSALQSITIPESITSIGAEAFGGCTSLTSVTFLGNACQERIGTRAFNGVGTTEKPATLVLPDSWTGLRPGQEGYWYYGIFSHEAPATAVGNKFEGADFHLRYEVTALGETNTVKVIRNTPNAYPEYSITIPATVKYNDVDFAVTEIGDSAFVECQILQSITIPVSVTTIRNMAFGSCTSLPSITIPESVTTIGDSIFLQCSSLQSIDLPANITTIGDYTFYMCSSLQSITLPASVTTIGYTAFCFSGLQTITIPAGVTEIGMGAFGGCQSLTSVTFSGSSCTIGEQAFLLVGTADNPATLVLPNSWTGTKPDQDGSWYGGYFKLGAPTALPTLKNADKAAVRKYIKNGRFEMEINGKTYNAVGAEL